MRSWVRLNDEVCGVVVLDVCSLSVHIHVSSAVASRVHHWPQRLSQL